MADNTSGDPQSQNQAVANNANGSLMAREAESSVHFAIDYEFHVTGVIIPQSVLKPRFQSILFIQKNGTVGVRLSDLLEIGRATEVLRDADKTPIISPSEAYNSRPSIYICWPGYDTWHHSITAYNSSVNRHNLAHIAFQIARVVQKFYNDNQVQGTEPGWRLDEISFNRLYLVELRHRQEASWQPVISADL